VRPQLTIAQLNGFRCETEAILDCAAAARGKDSQGIEVGPVVRLHLSDADGDVIMQFSVQGFRALLEDLGDLLNAEPFDELPPIIQWAKANG
jgi:hypothetical protein